MDNTELKKLAVVLDKAVESTDLRIQKSLSNLTAMVNLIEGEIPGYAGPFEYSLNYLDTLHKRITELELAKLESESQKVKNLKDKDNL